MSEPIHKTKGIVLKSVKYGDTSIIATIYTELFGVQSYLVKGIRKVSKKGASNINYFSPSAILDLQVYHNEFKQLQFIKEYKWDFLYENIYYDVVKNAVAMFAIELLQHSIKQPENNPDLYYFIEKCLIDLDKTNAAGTANFPLYFSLKLGDQLGFGIQEDYTNSTTILDLQEGIYCTETPIHPYFIEGNLALITTNIIKCKSVVELETIKLNKTTRRQLIEFYIQYFALHIANFIELRSVEVLREVLE
ncbi:MAG: DNA repair protein RecO [Chitinophagaceae bacterium]